MSVEVRGEAGVCKGLFMAVVERQSNARSRDSIEERYLSENEKEMVPGKQLLWHLVAKFLHGTGGD
jgi:hypothetical protein